MKLKLKKKPVIAPVVERPKEAKINRDPEICTTFNDRFKCELYAPLPEDQETIDLRTRSPYLVKASRKIFPCRIMYQQGGLTLTLPYKGYPRAAYKKRIDQLFKALHDLEKDLDIHFGGIIHGDEEKPILDDVPISDVGNVIPFTRKLNPNLKIKPKIKPMEPSSKFKLKLRKPK